MTSLSLESILQIEKGTEGVTPGPWRIYDGSSWRRIGTLPDRGAYDGAVLAPCVAPDGHPDLTSYAGDREANLAHIARLSPEVVAELCRLAKIGLQTEEAGAALERMKQREGEDVDAWASRLGAQFASLGDVETQAMAIRICPRRDGPCPHGMSCTYWRANMDCSTEPRTSIRQGAKT